MNSLFQATRDHQSQPVPPIWFMRQAGRYHSHYQKLRAKHSFMDLCKIPELAAEVAMGPIEDFDFDVAILFSDLLFPLEAMGMGLSYGDSGPALGWHLSSEADLARLRSPEQALEGLLFQQDAMKLTRERLPKNKSLIGFVGGPWTLFAYAAQGSHDGSLTAAKKALKLFPAFCEKLVPLLQKNIDLQLRGGAELVMVFDTAAGELSPKLFQSIVLPQMQALAERFPSRLGYYSKGTQWAHLDSPLMFENRHWAGLGLDHRWPLPTLLKERKQGFLQGNFDQALLHMERSDFEAQLNSYLEPFLELTREERAGWVCGLGHGVLPKTPEDNVRRFITQVREVFSKKG